MVLGQEQILLKKPTLILSSFKDNVQKPTALLLLGIAL